MNAVVVGPSRGVVEAFRDREATVAVVDPPTTERKLREAGVTEAAVVVITDVGEASAVPVARKLNPDVRLVVYDRETVPEFVRGQLDLAVDPDLMTVETVVEELVDGSDR